MWQQTAPSGRRRTGAELRRASICISSPAPVRSFPALAATRPHWKVPDSVVRTSPERRGMAGGSVGVIVRWDRSPKVSPQQSSRPAAHQMKQGFSVAGPFEPANHRDVSSHGSRGRGASTSDGRPGLSRRARRGHRGLNSGYGMSPRERNDGRAHRRVRAATVPALKARARVGRARCARAPPPPRSRGRAPCRRRR